MASWALTCFALATLQNGFVNAAFSWGDPVIETVGSPSYNYSFNGHGEYVFLKSANGLEIQARLDYFVHGNNDSTIFTAFTFTNHHVNDTVQIEFDIASKHISVFLNNGTLWKTSHNCTNGPPIRTLGFMLMCFRPPSVGVHLVPNLILNNIGLDVTTDREFMNIRVRFNTALTNMTGLAGNVHDGFYLSKNGTKFPQNATEHDMFDFGESWSLRNQPNLSKWNYNLTTGNFSYFNAFSKPRFLEDLLNNVTALFEKCNVTNVTTITEVCKNNWDRFLDKECMLIMARTCDLSLAAAVHKEVERQHEEFMRKSNIALRFLATMMNTTTIYNGNTSLVLNFTNKIFDDNMKELRFEVGPFISDEMKIDAEVFNWTVGTVLRNLSERTLCFTVYDKYNMSDDHLVNVRYCGCERPDQCRFESVDDDTAECVCYNQYTTGTYCEIYANPCDVYRCYDHHTCRHSNISGSPCTTCPRGFYEEYVGLSQYCNDVNECNNTHSHECDHVCVNIVGSYLCSCHAGYSLNADNRTCTVATVLFGKLSYSIDTSIHINISQGERDILLQNPVIDSGQLSDGNILMELLRQLGCAVGQTQSTRSDTIDGIGADKIPKALT